MLSSDLDAPYLTDEQETHFTGLEPAVLSKPPVYCATDGEDACEHDVIAILPFELWHVLEVHSIDAGDRRWHSQNSRPCGEPARDGGLLGLPDHQTRFKSERKHFAEGINLFLHAIDMIRHIAEERLHLLVNRHDFGMLQASADLRQR